MVLDLTLKGFVLEWFCVEMVLWLLYWVPKKSFLVHVQQYTYTLPTIVLHVYFTPWCTGPVVLYSLMYNPCVPPWWTGRVPPFIIHSINTLWYTAPVFLHVYFTSCCTGPVFLYVNFTSRYTTPVFLHVYYTPWCTDPVLHHVCFTSLILRCEHALCSSMHTIFLGVQTLFSFMYTLVLGVQSFFSSM